MRRLGCIKANLEKFVAEQVELEKIYILESQHNAEY